MLLLDTDVMIDIQRGFPPATAWLNSLVEVPSVPGYVAMELYQAARDRQQVQVAARLLTPFPIVWPSGQNCDRGAKDFFDHHLSHGLGLLDALIAACARGLSATLCTFNVKHFRVVPGLTTLQPYAHSTP